MEPIEQKSQMESSESQKASSHLQDEIAEHIEALKEEESAIREAALNALVSIGKPAIESLNVGLRSNNYHIRYCCAQILGQIGDATAVEPLIFALRDELPNQRGLAAQALGLLQDKRAVEPLLELLNKDEDWIVCTIAWEALISIGQVDIELLIKVLQTDNHLSRFRVVQILGDLKDVRAVQSLIMALTDIDPQVRAEAAQALSKIGDVSAIPHLTRLLKDKQRAVRTSASEALKALGVKNRRWWQL